jgi:hypothetical protein
MSTNDVPGAKKQNCDVLAVGCWAEHEDGSLILVKGFDESGRVVYEIFDMADTPATVYTDAMAEKEFKNFFSFSPSDKKSIKWTWHDKTEFPWDRVLKNTKRPVPGFASAEDQLTAAQRVVDSLLRRGHDLNKREASQSTMGHRTESVEMSRGRAIAEKLGEAFDLLIH